MNLDEIRNILTNFVQRDWAGGQWTAELNHAQLKYLDFAIKSEKEMHQLKVKKGEGSPPLYVIDGYADIPTDYFFFLSMNAPSGSDYTPIRKCDDETFNYLRNSSVEYPDSQYPICRFLDTQIQFLPTSILYVNFVYYKVPPTPVYGYTLTDGYLKYDTSTSTELDWHEDDQIAIIQIMLQDLGFITTREQLEAQKK